MQRREQLLLDSTGLPTAIATAEVHHLYCELSPLLSSFFSYCQLSYVGLLLFLICMLVTTRPCKPAECDRADRERESFLHCHINFEASRHHDLPRPQELSITMCLVGLGSFVGASLQAHKKSCGDVLRILEAEAAMKQPRCLFFRAFCPRVLKPGVLLQDLRRTAGAEIPFFAFRAASVVARGS